MILYFLRIFVWNKNVRILEVCTLFCNVGDFPVCACSNIVNTHRPYWFSILVCGIFFCIFAIISG